MDDPCVVQWKVYEAFHEFFVDWAEKIERDKAWGNPLTNWDFGTLLNRIDNMLWQNYADCSNRQPSDVPLVLGKVLRY